jgi:hypothetical protein
MFYFLLLLSSALLLLALYFEFTTQRGQTNAARLGNEEGMQVCSFKQFSNGSFL